MNTKVTYIIPVYNGEKTIEAAIESAAAMPYCNEIIVVDDGSTDSTSKVCNGLKTKYEKKIVYIRQENSGVSVARNTGIKNAHSEYIGFIDADDRVANNNRGNIEVAFGNNPDIIMFDYNTISNNETKVNSLDWEDGIKTFDEINLLCKRMLSYPICKNEKNTYLGGKVYQYFYKKEFLVDNLIQFDAKVVFAEDLCFVLRCLTKCKSMYYCKTAYYDYFVIDGSASHKYRENFWSELKCTYSVLDEMLNHSENIIGAYYFYAKIAIYNYISNSNQLGYAQLYAKIKEIVSDDLMRKELKDLKGTKWSTQERIKNFLIYNGMARTLLMMEMLWCNIKKMN